MTVMLAEHTEAVRPAEQEIDPETLRHVRAAVKEALETHLRHEPTKISRSRIKRLRGLSKPQYRLRVEDVRVFYDVAGSTVEVLAIVPKAEAEKWLNQFGNPA